MFWPAGDFEQKIYTTKYLDCKKSSVSAPFFYAMSGKSVNLTLFAAFMISTISTAKKRGLKSLSFMLNHENQFKLEIRAYP